MNRIDRLYTSAERIAEQYGISIRTVYRDIKALGEQGIPLSFEPSKGYFIVQGYFLPPVSFNSDKANALLLMERLLAGFADKSILTHYTSALNNVKSVLKTAQKDKLETLNEHIKQQLPYLIFYTFNWHHFKLNNIINIPCTEIPLALVPVDKFDWAPHEKSMQQHHINQQAWQTTWIYWYY